MIKPIISALVFGQLMAAQAISADPISTIQSSLAAHYGDDVKISSLHAHERALAPFDTCQELSASLTEGRQRLQRPRFELFCGDDGMRRRVVAQAEGSFRAITTTRDIRRGRMLNGHDMEITWLSLAEHRDDVLMSKSQAYGREVRMPLKQGRALRDSQLSPKYDIFPGQISDLIVNRSGLHFSIPVEAQEAGMRGDEIRVKNLSSDRIFRVKINEEGSLSL